MSACIYVYHMRAWWPQRPEEGFRELESLPVVSLHVDAGN